MSADADSTIIEVGTIGGTLDLSESRAYDAALEILRAYKLTGNFHVNLEIVLKDLGAFDDVTFEIGPKSYVGRELDRRRVVIWSKRNIQSDRFDEIIRSINDRIGFETKRLSSAALLGTFTRALSKPTEVLSRRRAAASV